jgi:dihydrofolate reductase
MRMKLTVHAFTTSDGVMQGPGGPDEDRTDGFTLGGWMAPYVDDDMGRIVDGWFDRADEFLLGRSTYDMMAAYWSQVTDPDNLVGRLLNARPKHVVGRTLDRADWQHSSIVTDDVEGSVRALKARDGGELQVHGSWQLVQYLQQHDLIDEYRVLAFPLVLGHGKRLFHEGARATALELVESRTTGVGATYSVLRPNGRPALGAFGVEDGQEVTALA